MLASPSIFSYRVIPIFIPLAILFLVYLSQQGRLKFTNVSNFSPLTRPYDVTYDVIGNPHYPYVIVDLGLQLTLQPED